MGEVIDFPGRRTAKVGPARRVRRPAAPDGRLPAPERAEMERLARAIIEAMHRRGIM